MAKKKLQLFGQARAIEIEADATVGAVFGVDLFWPDGRLVTIEDLQQSQGGGEYASTLWRLVQEIPANVVALEQLAGAGIVVKPADGSLAVRQLEVGDLLTIDHPGGAAGNPRISKNVMRHIEASPEPVWTINHNLGRGVTVDVFTAGGAAVMADVLLVSDNQAQVLFDQPMAGYAIIN